MPVLHPGVPPRSSLVPLQSLIDDEKSHLGFVTLTMTWMHIKNKVSSALDTNQGKGMKDKLKFTAKQLNNRI